MEKTQPIHWLQEEYFKRKGLDPHFSSRVFAKILGISSGRLSELFSGKRNITINQATKFSQVLGFDPISESKFKNSIIDQKKRELKRSEIVKNVKKVRNYEYKQLNQDHFELISKQQYYAILNLIETSSFRSSTKWISDRLQIPEPTIIKSIELLERIGLLSQEDGQFKRISKKLKTSDDIESRAIKAAHREKLQHAIVSLETIPVELRDITSITCPIEKAKLPEVKELIREFRRGLAKFMSEGECDEIYNINIQLVPLTNVVVKQ